MSDAEEKYDLFVRKIMDGVTPRVASATVPLFGLQDEVIKHDRSGVLIRIADDYYILTASHDLRQIVEANIPLFAGNWHASTKPLPLHQANFLTTEEDSRDVAVIMLERSMGKELATRHTPILLPDVDTTVTTAPSFLLLCGYPSAWLNVSPDGVRSDPLPYYGTWVKSVPNMQTLDFDPALHFLVSFERNAVDAISEQPITLPSVKGIKGISGCGVWRLCEWSREGIQRFSPDNVRLIGIQHRYSEKEGWVAATWLKYALRRLVDDHPKVIAPMKLLYPKRG